MSPKVSVDMSEARKSMEPVPEGVYECEIEKCEVKPSSSGNLMAVFTFEVQTGDWQGRKFWHNCSFLPQAAFKLLEVLNAVGMEVTEDNIEFDSDELVGKQCLVTVNQEEYEGKLQNKVQKVNAMPARSKR